MQRRIFITGTDTEVGKTFFTAALVTALQKSNQSVVALKPIAAGSEWIDGQLKNEDALTLLSVMKESFDYSVINPVALKNPVAPHIAAVQEGRDLSVSALQNASPLAHYSHQLILIEGAGGWLVPLNDEETFADYVSAEALEVVLVVGMKLGCINHALLTAQNISMRGLKLVGWVANFIDPQMANQQENLQTLKSRLDCPLLAEIPFLSARDSNDDDDNVIVSASKYVKLDHFIS